MTRLSRLQRHVLVARGAGSSARPDLRRQVWSCGPQPPRGTTLAAGAGLATAFRGGLLRGLSVGLLRSPAWLPTPADWQ